MVLLTCLIFTALFAAGCSNDEANDRSTTTVAPVPKIEKVAETTKKSPSYTNLRETPRTTKRNVVMIVLESTRARSVTPYNKDLATTPFLDELSKKSLLAERAYTVVPHTTKALVASECGIPPHLIRKITESKPDGIPARCLPDLLKEQGYKTAWFQNGTYNFEGRPQLVKNFGYDEYYSQNDMKHKGFERVAFGYEENMMLEPSRKWLQKNGDSPFLITYKTVTPHSQYLDPSRYGTVDFTGKEKLNRYLNSVRYVDFFLKNLFDQYKKLGLYDDTIFVIYGDHGEGFGEHGRYQHDNTTYQEGLRIPLIIHDPQRWKNGERVTGLTNQLDILPTVLDLLGYEVQSKTYPGYSMLDLPKDRTLMSSCWYDNLCMASIHGDEKYIYHYGRRHEELFDLKNDPLEKNNLAGPLEGEKQDRRAKLFEWRRDVNSMYKEE